jgi:hypothetical protein
MSETKRKALLGLVAVTAAAGLTAGIADAAKSSDGDKPKKARGHRMFAPPAELTGEAAEKAKAAAQAAVPDATVDHAFKAPPRGPDADAAYVVIMEKADGTHVAVLLDKDFTVLRTVDRMRRGGRRGGPCGPAGRPAELTGEAAEKAKAAAQAAVPDATVDHAFKAPPRGPDADAAYVVIMEKADGSHVAVLLDKDFKVLRTQEGPPRGGPRGHGHGPPGWGPPPGPPPGRRPGSYDGAPGETFV